MHLIRLLCLALTLPSAARAADAVFPFAGGVPSNPRQPQAAVDTAGRIHIVVGSENDLYCATSTDGGATYASPVRVGRQGVLSLGMRRGPRVATAKTGLVVTAICGEQGKGRDGDVLAWRSTDGGATWRGPVAINRVPGSAREGLHGLAAGPDGTVCCVWLDLRNKRMEVFLSLSTDAGQTWSLEQRVYQSPGGNVCECCQPSAAYDAAGGLHVMWRNQLSGNRDMYLSSSTDGGRTFGPAAKLGRGAWRLLKCPMDGGALAADGASGMQTIWMRDKELFRATPGLPEESLGRGEQGWASAGPGGVWLTWIRTRPGAVLVLAPGAEKPVQLAERGWDPVVAGRTDGKVPLVVAWEEGTPQATKVRSTVLGAP